MRKIVSWIALTAVCVCSTSAMAGNVGLHFSGTGLGQSAKLFYDGSQIGGSGEIFIGQLNWTVTSSSHSSFSVGDSITTFCSDIFHFLNRNQSNSVGTLAQGGPSGSPMGDFKAGLVSGLYSSHYNDAVGMGATNLNAAAFQLALWELVNEDFNESAGGPGTLGFDLDSGRFEVTNNASAKTLAESWLSDIWADRGTNVGLVSLNPWGGGQGQLMIIPLPSGFGIGVAGLAMLAVPRRRRRNT